MEDIGYLSTSWNHLQDTIKAAEGLVNAENPDANEIEIMKRQLTDAMVKLVLSVDNEQLKSFVDDLSNLEQKVIQRIHGNNSKLFLKKHRML